MNRLFLFALVLCVAAAGCSNTSATGKPGDGKAADGGKVAGTEIALTGENTKIEFVGLHTDPNKPDPRKGGFKSFTGKAIVDAGALKAIEVEIDTESVYTEIDKLTNHLKSVDFFDVRQFPKAKFVSTKIETAGDGKVNITGDLTLLKETKSITFPATVSAGKDLKLTAEFKIDRTQFGMTYGEKQVEKDVAMTITVGK
jgi:polyisoprenoid-binding protein YceI